MRGGTTTLPAMRPATGADLRSAPVPPLRGDDHVRGPDGAPVVLLYGDFTCPRCAPAAQRLQAA